MHEITGQIELVLEGGASLPFDGHGRLFLGDRSAPTSVSIDGGRFVHQDARAVLDVLGVSLDGLDGVAKDGQAVRGGMLSVVRCAVDSAFLRLVVIDAETKRPLDEVSILAAGVNAAQSKPKAPPGFLPPHSVLPPDGARAVIERAASPLLISRFLASDMCWIGARDHGWMPWVFPAECAECPVTFTIELKARCDLILDVSGASRAAGEIDACVYEDDVPEPDHPLAVRPVIGESTVFSGLSAGKYVARIETKARLPLASASVELYAYAGQPARVELVYDPKALTKRSISGWVEFEPSGTITQPTTILIAPVSLGPRRAGENHHIEDLRRAPSDSGGTLDWGPVLLTPGTYALVVEPQHAVQEFEVGESKPDVVETRLSGLTERFASVVDAGTGSLVPLSSFEWSSPLDAVEAFRFAHTLSMASPTTLENPVRIEAMDGPLLMLARAEGYGAQIRLVEAGAGRDPVWAIAKMARVSITLLGHPLDMEWLRGIAVHSEGLPVRIEGTAMSIVPGSHEAPRGTISIFASGDVDMDFPPLLSTGFVPSRRVVVTPGEETSIEVDARGKVR